MIEHLEIVCSWLSWRVKKRNKSWKNVIVDTFQKKIVTTYLRFVSIIIYNVMLKYHEVADISHGEKGRKIMLWY